MTQPRISVVVTCFNLGRFLNETLDSVYAQTFQNFEVLVVDDGSTEPATLDVLAGCETPRTRVIRSPNRGLPAARNLGISESHAPYICTLDADDKLEPTWFAKALAILEDDPSVSFVSHWLQTFGDEIWDWRPTDCDFPALLDVNTVNGAALVRRDAVAAVGGFDERMRQGCEDWALWLEMVDRGFRGVIIPEVLFFYRRRADSMSRVMMENDAYLATFGDLMARHAQSYRKHAVDLILRREQRMTELLRGIHDLELEYEQMLREQLLAQRESLAALEAKAERVRKTQESAARFEEAMRLAQTARNDAQAILIENEALRNEHERLQRRYNELTEERAETLARARGDLQGAIADASALRASMSWRVTAPLRTVYGWLLKMRQPLA